MEPDPLWFAVPLRFWELVQTFPAASNPLGGKLFHWWSS
jgi:hypothetical protein